MVINKRGIILLIFDITTSFLIKMIAVNYENFFLSYFSVEKVQLTIIDNVNDGLIRPNNVNVNVHGVKRQERSCTDECYVQKEF